MNQTTQTTPTFGTTYQRFQFYCLWNISPTLREYLDTYKVTQISAHRLREELRLTNAAKQKQQFIFFDGFPYPVSWHNASPYQLLRDSQSNKRGRTDIHYWVSLRKLGADKVALITVNLNSLDKPSKGELDRHII